ncbi:hypothetical protein CJF31_00007108 [Rutstroemia sp. NJR-2017a BVV2]|nr:hypothetical protein CJF31_00007108 [Rutstroemia sp. NJR-2017a BVV2]
MVWVDLCSFLGYEKDRPGKNSKDLLRATSAFLKDNESRGLRLPPSSKRTDPVEAQLCAMIFLEEEERGEKFWPSTSDGSLTYENDSQVHVFRHLSNYRKAKRKRENEKPESPKEVELCKPTPEDESSTNPSTPTIPEASMQEGAADDSDITAIYASPMESLRPELSLTPWLQPPKRFDRHAAVQLLDELDPEKLTGVSSSLSKDWLSQVRPQPVRFLRTNLKQQDGIKWPPLAERRLQHFMHHNMFYYSVNLEAGTDDRIQRLVDILRSTEEIDGSLLREFRTRIVDKVKYFTQAFINSHFVEIQPDGVPRMTSRFRNVWVNRYGAPAASSASSTTLLHRESSQPGERSRKKRKISKSLDESVTSDRDSKKRASSEYTRKSVTQCPNAPKFPNLLPRKDSNLVTMSEAALKIVEDDEEKIKGTDCELQEAAVVEVMSAVKSPTTDHGVVLKDEMSHSHTELDADNDSTITIGDFGALSNETNIKPSSLEHETDDAAEVEMMDIDLPETVRDSKIVHISPNVRISDKPPAAPDQSSTERNQLTKSNYNVSSNNVRAENTIGSRDKPSTEAVGTPGKSTSTTGISTARDTASEEEVRRGHALQPQGSLRETINHESIALSENPVRSNGEEAGSINAVREKVSPVRASYSIFSDDPFSSTHRERRNTRDSPLSISPTSSLPTDNQFQRNAIPANIQRSIDLSTPPQLSPSISAAPVDSGRAYETSLLMESAQNNSLKSPNVPPNPVQGQDPAQQTSNQHNQSPEVLGNHDNMKSTTDTTGVWTALHEPTPRKPLDSPMKRVVGQQANDNSTTVTVPWAVSTFQPINRPIKHAIPTSAPSQQPLGRSVPDSIQPRVPQRTPLPEQKADRITSRIHPSANVFPNLPGVTRPSESQESPAMAHAGQARMSAKPIVKPKQRRKIQIQRERQSQSSWPNVFAGHYAVKSPGEKGPTSMPTYTNPNHPDPHTFSRHRPLKDLGGTTNAVAIATSPSQFHHLRNDPPQIHNTKETARDVNSYVAPGSSSGLQSPLGAGNSTPISRPVEQTGISKVGSQNSNSVPLPGTVKNKGWMQPSLGRQIPPQLLSDLASLRETTSSEKVPTLLHNHTPSNNIQPDSQQPRPSQGTQSRNQGDNNVASFQEKSTPSAPIIRTLDPWWQSVATRYNISVVQLPPEVGSTHSASAVESRKPYSGNSWSSIPAPSPIQETSIVEKSSHQANPSTILRFPEPLTPASPQQGPSIGSPSHEVAFHTPNYTTTHDQSQNLAQRHSAIQANQSPRSGAIGSSVSRANPHAPVQANFDSRNNEPSLRTDTTQMQTQQTASNVHYPGGYKAPRAIQQPLNLQTNQNNGRSNDRFQNWPRIAPAAQVPSSSRSTSDTDRMHSQDIQTLNRQQQQPPKKPTISSLIHPSNIQTNLPYGQSPRASTMQSTPPFSPAVQSPAPNFRHDMTAFIKSESSSTATTTPSIPPSQTNISRTAPKLDFYLQQKNRSINTVHAVSHTDFQSFTSSSFFSYFAHFSGVPLDELESVVFRCMFGEYQRFALRKDRGEAEWKKVRKRIWRVWEGELREAGLKGNAESDEDEVWEVNILIGDGSLHG